MPTLARNAATFLIAALLLAGPAAAEVTLNRVQSVVTSPAQDVAIWDNDESIVLTGHDVKLINWSGPVGPERTLPLFLLPVASEGLDAWGDSVVVRLPGMSNLLLSPDIGGASEPEGVETNFRLPNNRIGNQVYRLFLDPALYLLIYSAPGPPYLVSLFDFNDTIGAGHAGAFGGDRAALANGDGVWILDLSNPLVPNPTELITPPDPDWTATAVGIRDRVLFVLWGGRIQTYDLSNPFTPVLLDEISSNDLDFVLGPRWLVSSSPGDSYLAVVNATDPAALTLRMTIPTGATVDAVALQRDRVLVTHGLELRSFRIPASGGLAVAEGKAFPVLQGDLLASDGHAVWLQDGRDRYVVDLGAGRLAATQTGTGAPGDHRDQYHVRGDVLYHLRAGQGLDIYDLSVPEAPALITTLDHSPPPLAADVGPDGDWLAVADGQELVFYDVVDPADPARDGALPLVATPQRVRLTDVSAVVLTGDLETSEPGQVHVIDASDHGAPQTLDVMPAAPDGDTEIWTAAEGVWHGDQLRVLCTTSGDAGLGSLTLTVDLVDPLVPAFSYSLLDDGQWCWGDLDLGQPVVRASDPPVRLGDLHISFYGDTVSVYADPGGVEELERLTWWVAPGPVEELTRVGNRILVLSDHRLDILTASDPEGVGVPDRLAAGQVRAVPNPFNPRTRLHFTMPAAGEARVTLYDARGRRVRALRATLPAGPAALRWDGATDAGQAAPSGTYLVRVVTPAGVQAGRCQLVR